MHASVKQHRQQRAHNAKKRPSHATEVLVDAAAATKSAGVQVRACRVLSHHAVESGVRFELTSASPRAFARLVSEDRR
jgi:hypothetical protein